MAEHNDTLANIRVDEYSFGAFESLAELVSKYDYSSLDYDQLHNIYMALETTGMQYGAALARTIVDTLSAFEIGQLPTVVVYDATSGKEDEKATMFAQNFLNEQHPALIEAITTKNIYGDGYLVFNIDRNLESLPPKMVFPGWSPYSSGLDSATIIQIKRIKSQQSSQTAELKIIRNYTAKDIKYQSELVEKIAGVMNPKPVSIKNPLGICPVVHLPNMRPAGYQFGVSDFYSSIPYFLLYHHTLMRGYESQQYSGRPIMSITGIEGSVSQWLQLSFGIDPSSESQDSLTSKILDMFKKNKMFAFSGNVTAQFIEPKMPIGKTEEILKVCLNQIARLSSVPEFVFGASLDQANSAVREQYASLRAKVELKHSTLTPYFRHLIRMAMVWYSTISKNEETGEPLETFGLVNTFEDATKKYRIELIWPEFLGSEQRTKIESLAMLSQAGAISRKGLQKNYPTLIPSPDAEMAQIELEATQFAPEIPNQPQGTKNAAARRNKDKSNVNDNADASKTDQPSNRSAGV